MDIEFREDICEQKVHGTYRTQIERTDDSTITILPYPKAMRVWVPMEYDEKLVTDSFEAENRLYWINGFRGVMCIPLSFIAMGLGFVITNNWIGPIIGFGLVIAWSEWKNSKSKKEVYKECKIKVKVRNKYLEKLKIRTEFERNIYEI